MNKKFKNIALALIMVITLTCAFPTNTQAAGYMKAYERKMNRSFSGCDWGLAKMSNSKIPICVVNYINYEKEINRIYFYKYKNGKAVKIGKTRSYWVGPSFGEFSEWRMKKKKLLVPYGSGDSKGYLVFSLKKGKIKTDDYCMALIDAGVAYYKNHKRIKQSTYNRATK